MSTSTPRTQPLVMTRMMTATLITSLCLVTSCALWDAANPSSDGGDDAPDAVSLDTGADGIDIDIADASQAEDVAQASDCQVGDGLGVLEVDRGRVTPQFQARAAFDGAGIWVVYVRTSAQSPEGSIEQARDIIATRISCAGEVLVAPFAVNENPIHVESPTPSIDVKRDTVYLAWNSKSAWSSPAHQIYFRTLSVGGDALMPAERLVNFNGSTPNARVSDSVTESDIVALNQGGALVVGSTFDMAERRVFFQRLDDLGESVGPAVPVDLASDSFQTRPAISVDPSDHVWVSWQSLSYGQDSYGPNYTAYRSFDIDAPEAPSAVELLQISSPKDRRARISRQIPHAESVYLASVTDEYGSHRIALLNAATDTDYLLLGQEAVTNDYPAVVSWGGGGAVAWFVRDIRSEELDEKVLLLQPFRPDGAHIQVGAPVEVAVLRTDVINGEHRGGPDIVHLGQDDYFVLWHEGSDARKSKVRGRFVKARVD
ncbi:hypothetical protein [Bradymonas sediminis]|nr:hypothetical protein [Bradymonas sediminis]TDP77514.1 hypothetical protein DFR33_101416 [Bradymonas sediminis]